jgi:predicted Zn finger-like uncharacterized protein
LIVTCEQCSTQFHLDDAKVPPGGVRVRCSRCKHAFFIEPAGASPELGSIDRAAQDALHAQAPLAPEAAEDLSAEPGSEFEDSNELSSESDWEFNRASFSADPPEESEAVGTHDAAREAIDDLLGSRGSSSRAAAVLSAPRNPLEPVDAQGPLAAPALDTEEEDLGSPESWDLLAGDSPSSADSGQTLEPEVAGAETRRDPPAPAQYRALPPSLAEWTPPREPSVVLAWIARMGHAIGWSVTAILFSIVAILTLAPAGGPDAEAQFGQQRLAGLEAQGISGRWVENAVSGSLYVVSGRLVNPNAQAAALGTRIGVRLLDANGARLPLELAAAGPVLPERELREADPAGLQVRQAEGSLALAAELIQPGQSVAFEAVVGVVPLAASRFLLEPLAPGRNAQPANAGDPAPGS